MHTYQKKMLVDCTDRSLEISRFVEDNTFIHGQIKRLAIDEGKHGAVRVIERVGFCYFENEEDEETTKILQSCGGFFAASLKEEKLSRFYAEFPLPRNITAIVVMHKDTMRRMDDKSLQFILLHEYAHVNLGHLSLTEEQREVEYGASGVPRIELAADLYAAYAIGLSTSIRFLRATRKMFASALRVAPQVFDINTDDGKLVRKGLRQIAGRISALQAAQRRLSYF